MASSTVPTSEDNVLRVPLTQIVPSKHNARKAGLTPEGLQELANSIKQNGVIVPIKLRDMGEKKFRIVFGERRFRASLLAFEGGSVEALTIPATVHTMTDEQEEEERAIENLQRADLAPLEEAQEFKRLMRDGLPVDIAAKLGKEEAYVVKRLKLLSLVPEAQKALQDDKIQLGHALEICRLDPENQKRVLKFMSGDAQVNAAPKGQYDWQQVKTTITVEGLRQFIQKNLLVELSRAKFDLKDPELNPKMGACTACPHNTANAGALFSDLKSAKCNLPECFFGKEATALDNKLAAIAADRGVKSVYRLSDGGSQHDNRGLGSVKVDGYYYSHSDEIAIVPAGKECEHTIPAVFVHVDEERYRSAGQKKYKVGDEVSVCLDAKCKEHHKIGSGSSSATGPKKGLALVNHKETNLGKSRQQRTRNEAFKQIAAKLLEDDSFPKALRPKLEIIAPYAAAHLYSDRWRDAGKALGIEKPASKQYGGPNWEAAIAKMFKDNPWGLLLLTVIAEDLPASGSWNGKGSKGALSAMADFYKVDMAEISREFQKQDRELIKGMRERAEARKADTKPKKEKKVKAVPGFDEQGNEVKKKKAKKAKAKKET